MSSPSLPPASTNGASVIKWTGIFSDLPGVPGQPGLGKASTRARRRSRRAPGTRPVPLLRPNAPLPDPAMMGLSAVPDPAPPYDDELPANAAVHGSGRAEPDLTGQGDRDLAGRAKSGTAETRPDPANTAPVNTAPVNTDQAGRVADARLPAKRMRGDKHTQTAWPNLFAQVLAEALAGSRPARQLSPWTTQQARGHIRRLGPLLRASREPQASSPRSFATDGKRSMAGSEPRVRRVVASMPSADVVEMAVVVRFGPRVRALAVRLEHPEGRKWICTAIEAA
jgi:Family of unknown function (DUF6459)